MPGFVSPSSPGITAKAEDSNVRRGPCFIYARAWVLALLFPADPELSGVVRVCPRILSMSAVQHYPLLIQRCAYHRNTVRSVLETPPVWFRVSRTNSPDPFC